MMIKSHLKSLSFCLRQCALWKKPFQVLSDVLLLKWG